MKKAIIYRVALRFGLFILLANLSAGWMVARPGLAAESDIAVIADRNTAIPGGSGNFFGFDFPSLDGRNVAFRGEGSGQKGIYTDSRIGTEFGGGLGVVADENTAISRVGRVTSQVSTLRASTAGTWRFGESARARTASTPTLGV